MLMNMLTYIFILVLVGVSGRAHFRSLLLERACQKRPSLDFCTAVTSTTSTTTTTTTTTTTAATTPLKLVPPPAVTEIPIAAGNHTKNHINDDDLGTLLRLPKPLNVSHTEEKVDPFDDTVVKANKTAGTHHGAPRGAPPEDEKTVLVYISEYCVVEREHFVKVCHGDVEESDLPFCKAYPPACASAPGVLPVISYCQRYFRHYPKHCTAHDIPTAAIQFCYAFEQFCLPELTPAKPPSEVIEEKQHPTSALKRCEDVVDEARKICNPFPRPKDTFNVIRCTNFLTNCREFIDWD